jgi:hypothetical protein
MENAKKLGAAFHDNTAVKKRSEIALRLKNQRNFFCKNIARNIGKQFHLTTK